MSLFHYTNRQIIEEARTLMGDPYAEEKSCREFVTRFIQKVRPTFKPGDELSQVDIENVGFRWNQEVGGAR